MNTDRRSEDEWLTTRPEACLMSYPLGDHASERRPLADLVQQPLRDDDVPNLLDPTDRSPSERRIVFEIDPLRDAPRVEPVLDRLDQRLR